MATTMKAAMVGEFGKLLTVQEFTVPNRRAGKVPVKIKATGVCHTDLHAADGDWPLKPTLPFNPRQDGAGIVAMAGSAVKSLKRAIRSVLHGYRRRAALANAAFPVGNAMRACA